MIFCRQMCHIVDSKALAALTPTTNKIYTPFYPCFSGFAVYAFVWDQIPAFPGNSKTSLVVFTQLLQNCHAVEVNPVFCLQFNMMLAKGTVWSYWTTRPYAVYGNNFVHLSHLRMKIEFIPRCKFQMYGNVPIWSRVRRNKKWIFLVKAFL